MSNPMPTNQKYSALWKASENNPVARAILQNRLILIEERLRLAGEELGRLETKI